MEMKKLPLLFLLTAFALTPAWGQSKMSPLLRQTLRKAETKSSVQDSVFSAVKKVKAGKTYISAFVKFNDEAVIDSLTAHGAVVRTRTASFATAYLPLDEAERISELRCVDYVEMGSPVTVQMDEAKKASNATDVLNGIGLPQAFDGEGVIVGVIDNGFEFGHPDFYDKEKSELRIRRVWNQNLEGNPPAGYEYGTEYTTADGILAAKIDDASVGHGTHVTGIAAGADDTGGHDYAGLAQGSDIVLVAMNEGNMLLGDNTTILDGINYIFDYADEQGKPCVINMSLGSFVGPRDGTSSFDQMCDELQGPGRLIVGALGNDGGTTCHASMTFDAEEGDTLRTLFKFTYSYLMTSYTEIWGDEGMDLTIVPVTVDRMTGKVDARLNPFTIAPGGTGSETEYAFDGIDGSLVVSSEINPLNGKPHLSLAASFMNDDGRYIGFMVTSTAAGTVHAWADNVYSSFDNYDVDGFVAGDDTYTAGEIGGTGERIISVGAYVTRDHYEEYGIYHPSGEKLGAIASFTSKGPTADGRLKPDVCAPGTYIVSSISRYATTTPRAQKVTWNGESYYYGFMQGTSMATPFVTGAMALWLQVCPDLTPEKAKEIMRTTAINDNFTGDVRADGDYAWGYGKLDVLAGIKECIKSSGIDGGETLLDVPFVVRDEAGAVSVLFTRDLTDAALTVTSVDGKVVMADTGRNFAAGEEVRLMADGYAPGIYLVTILSPDGGRHTEKIIID